jgi:hypothetical protein
MAWAAASRAASASSLSFLRERKKMLKVAIINRSVIVKSATLRLFIFFLRFPENSITVHTLKVKYKVSHNEA